MPNAAPCICLHPGCEAATLSRYCERHASDNHELSSTREREARRRSVGLKKLYDSAAWRVRTVRFILARDPLCQIGILCDGTAPSTDIDHAMRAELYIAQHDGDETFFFDPNNLRGACHACHSHKSQLERRGLWKESPPPEP